MVAKSITAGGVQVAQGGFIPYRYNVSTSDVTINSCSLQLTMCMRCWLIWGLILEMFP